MSLYQKFDGKVALITGMLILTYILVNILILMNDFRWIGSSSGIGEEAALHLAELGANVVVTGRDEQRIKNVAEKCHKISGGKRMLSVAADLGKDKDLKNLIDRTIDTFGRLDILVNNAGRGDLSYMCDPKIMELYDNIMHLNVRSVMCLTSLAIPYLEKTKGTIINISSIAAMKPVSNLKAIDRFNVINDLDPIQAPKTTVYCMSKCCIDMLTKCMAIEMAPKGIRVNSINPAVTETPLLKKKYGDKFEQIREMRSKQYPIGRIGQPYDIANAIEYLASREASFITGTNLLMDGGALWGSTQKEWVLDEAIGE